MIGEDLSEKVLLSTKKKKGTLIEILSRTSPGNRILQILWKSCFEGKALKVSCGLTIMFEKSILLEPLNNIDTHIFKDSLKQKKKN